MKIRSASIETDLPAVVRLINPHETNPVTIDQARSWFTYLPPERITSRLVAVDEKDAVIGYSVLNHETTMPAHYFHAWLVVDPALRTRGIGSALWGASLDFLRSQGATRISTEISDLDPAGLAFAQRRGFAIDRRLFQSFLNLASFDETHYLPIISDLEAQGIRFCSLADFPDIPLTRRKLYDLNNTSVLDIPGVTSSPWTFEFFEHFVIEAPWFNREGQLLALDGDEWVGMAAVSLNPETHSAYNEHTGVRRAYRGRKVATALKVLAVRYACQHGANRIGTDNDSLNPPILALNHRLGYQVESGQYVLVCWM